MKAYTYICRFTLLPFSMYVFTPVPQFFLMKTANVLAFTQMCTPEYTCISLTVLVIRGYRLSNSEVTLQSINTTKTPKNGRNYFPLVFTFIFWAFGYSAFFILPYKHQEFFFKFLWYSILEFLMGITLNLCISQAWGIFKKHWSLC